MPESRLLSRAIPWWGWLFAAAGVIGLDQLTKWLIQQVLVFGQALPVLPFFNLVLVYNPGAAFSFLSTAAGWQRELFVCIALAACVLILFLLRRYAHDYLFCFALSLILGGAVGNATDRVLLGAVVDFLDVHAAGRYEVVIDYTCPEPDAGSLVELSFQDSRLSGRVTPGWNPPLYTNQDTLPRPHGESQMKEFHPLKLGEISLEKGEAPLTLRALEIPGKSVMDVRRVTLTLLP